MKIEEFLNNLSVVLSAVRNEQRSLRKAQKELDDKDRDYFFDYHEIEKRLKKLSKAENWLVNNHNRPELYEDESTEISGMLF